jgi:hypothetical protein
MKFIKTKEDTVCAPTRDEEGVVIFQRIRYAGSVIAVEDAYAVDMVKYKKGTLHPGPTRDIFELGGADAELAPLEPKGAPERLDLAAKLARAEKAVAPAQRAGSL